MDIRSIVFPINDIIRGYHTIYDCRLLCYMGTISSCSRCFAYRRVKFNTVVRNFVPSLTNKLLLSAVHSQGGSPTPPIEPTLSGFKSLSQLASTQYAIGEPEILRKSAEDARKNQPHWGFFIASNVLGSWFPLPENRKAVRNHL